MKTTYINVNLKDNLATAAVLAATVVTILGALGNSTEARANHVPATQQMETIAVTASRMESARMDTIVVTASRETHILVASN